MYRSQAQFRYAYRLPADAFDIQEWTMNMYSTGIDEVKHYLRWREPNKTIKGLNNAFMRSYAKRRDGSTEEADSGIPDYQLSQAAREDMVTHDFTRSQWGHSLSTFKPLPDNKGEAMGFGDNIEQGHFLILRNGTSTTRYRVDSIDYFRDPSDMWQAKLSFSPRPE
jgi:hypothetical protein